MPARLLATCPGDHGRPGCLPPGLYGDVRVTRLILAAALVALVAVVSAPAMAAALPSVAIDPGHGGADTGAVGEIPPGTETGLPPHVDKNGRVLLYEKDVNLDVAQRLAAWLAPRGFVTLMTRTADLAGGDRPYTSESDDLRARVDLANAAGAGLFVSIHQNSASSPASGTETYVFRQASDASRALALAIHQEVVARIGLPDRGVRDAGFYVLRHTSMPSALVEGAFLSNPGDALLLAQPDFRQRMAEGIGAGIARYAGLLDTGVVQPPVPTRVTLARAGSAMTKRAGINPRKGDLWVASLSDQSGAPMVGVPLRARLPNGKGVDVSTRGDGRALLAVPRRPGRLTVAVAVPGIRVAARGNVPARR